MNNSYTWYKDKLKGEYYDTFDRIELYGITHNTGTQEVFEERMMNLLDSMLAAQKNNSPVSKVIGKDTESFCRMYFEKITMAERLSGIPKAFIPVAWVILVFGIFEIIGAAQATEGVISIWSIKTDITPYIIGIIAGIIIGIVTDIVLTVGKPLVFKAKWMKTGMVYAAILVILALGIIAAVIFGGAVGDAGEINVNAMAPALVSAGYLLIYYIVKALINMRKYGSVFQPKDKVSFFKMVDESVTESMPAELKKRYEKINSKREKKGKAPLTPDDYMEKLRKEAVNDRKGNIAAIIMIILVCICMVVLTSLEEGIGSGLGLAAVLLLVEIPVIKWVYKDVKGQGYKDRVLAKCDELGINVIELAEREASGENEESEECDGQGE